MSWSRRRVLQAGGALAGVSAAGLLAGTARSHGLAARSPAAGGNDSESRIGVPKRITLLNLHTDEHLEIEYFRDGVYVPKALSAIEVLLRDFRTGDQHSIEPTLMDYLVDVAGHLGMPPAYSVISGYRSAESNAHSLHMQGRAIDVRMAGVDSTALAAHARDLMRGGVGYYRVSNFVHMDTGSYRTWNG